MNTPTTRVDVAELAPDTGAYLGQLAYAQLAFYQFVTETARRTEPLLDTQIISSAAARALRIHQDICAEITSRGDDPVEQMAPFVARTDAFLDILRGSRGIEGVLTAYIVFGFLNDVFVAVAEGMGTAPGRRYAAAITSNRDDGELADVLIRRIDAEERRAHILALWGRRVLGDTILFAHAIVRDPGDVAGGGSSRCSPRSSRATPAGWTCSASPPERQGAAGAGSPVRAPRPGCRARRRGRDDRSSRPRQRRRWCPNRRRC
ncbi:hypothetical protein FM119_06010 [Mycetocola reblochoni REB411]|uniref:Ferritin-like domain-containing protein n=1 Tax=Mycetocola reblochoni REB411 TaxID=1255698 RepID=A0A1R4J8Q4_9MICO|nr:hypothetical protein FM119_06010 [Mycetocola reblochoni REB411]